MKNKTIRVLSMLLVLVMVLGLCACGAGNPATPAESSAAESSAEAPAEVKLKIGIITTSGIDDGSFNQNCYEGITAFIATHPDCTVTDVKEADLSKVIETVGALVGSYDVMVLPGYNFAAVAEIAQANTDKYFIVVDSTITDLEGNAVSGLPNVYTMTFKEQESGFFAGVAAALSTKTNKVEGSGRFNFLYKA